jgi:hypothetical protein
LQAAPWLLRQVQPRIKPGSGTRATLQRVRRRAAAKADRLRVLLSYTEILYTPFIDTRERVPTV